MRFGVLYRILPKAGDGWIKRVKHRRIVTRHGGAKSNGHPHPSKLGDIFWGAKYLVRTSPEELLQHKAMRPLRTHILERDAWWGGDPDFVFHGNGTAIMTEMVLVYIFSNPLKSQATMRFVMIGRLR